MTDTTTRATPTIQSGIALMVLAMALVPIGDTLSKLLTDQLHPVEIAFWRFLGQAGILLAVLVGMRISLKPHNLALLMLAGITTAGTLVTLIGAFAVMPIATAIAIFFVEPLLLTVISALVLKEPTGWRRFAAVGVGLIGAVIVIRPNFATFGPAALFPLLAALSFATHVACLRRMSSNMGALAIQFWVSLFAMIFLGIILAVLILSGATPFGAPDLELKYWGIIAIAWCMSVITFSLITEAFRRTPAAILAPFQYLEIVGATLLGLMIFGDFPDPITWVGTAIILLSGFYVFHRERQRGDKDRRPEEVRD